VRFTEPVVRVETDFTRLRFSGLSRNAILKTPSSSNVRYCFLGEANILVKRYRENDAKDQEDVKPGD